MVESTSDTRDKTGDPFDGTVYKLVRPLARGGMGEVFLVEHRQLGRQLVAKLLKDNLAGNSQIVDRFRIEAQSLGRLRHPNIVSIIGFGVTRDNRPFFVTEYLKGQTLAQALASGTVFTVEQAIRYAGEMLSALAAAHEIGIVHRDIKPENLFIQRQPDGATQIKLLDFGLARVIPGVSTRAPAPLSIPTDTGLVFGTPSHLSPEGALGKHVDHRADLYGVGLILYTMLVGRGPFEHAKDKVAAMTAHLTETPVAPSTVARISVPPELDAIVLKALEKDADARFQTATEFADRLREVTHLSGAAIRTAKAVEPQPLGANSNARTDESEATVEFAAAGNKKLASARPSRLVLVLLMLLSALTVFVGGWLITKHDGP